MSAGTAISWADDTFNPWEGCQKVSPACDGCYAEARNLRYAPKGTTEAPNWGPGAPRRRTSASNWNKPLKWEREQAAKVKHANDNGLPLPPPRFVFCASLADVFDNAVPAEWRRDLFDLIRATPHLTWLLLTKRPGNIVKLFTDAYWPDHVDPTADDVRADWPRNAAIGCTVVTQEEADRDIPKLLDAKAALNPAFAFVSMEPLLGPVDLEHITAPGDDPDWKFSALQEGEYYEFLDDLGVWCGGEGPHREALDWVITGGETDQGPHKARPHAFDWERSIRDQCAAAGVPYHRKQAGEFIEVDRDAGEVLVAGQAMKRVGKKAAGRLLDGVTHDARPAPSPLEAHRTAP